MSLFSNPETFTLFTSYSTFRHLCRGIFYLFECKSSHCWPNACHCLPEFSTCVGKLSLLFSTFRIFHFPFSILYFTTFSVTSKQVYACAINWPALKSSFRFRSTRADRTAENSLSRGKRTNPHELEGNAQQLRRSGTNAEQKLRKIQSRPNNNSARCPPAVAWARGEGGEAR